MHQADPAPAGTFTPEQQPAPNQRAAEPRGGAFEQLLAQRARAGGGYLVGSDPEGKGGNVFHILALAGPAGTILGRYRATHLTASERAWASCGW